MYYNFNNIESSKIFHFDTIPSTNTFLMEQGKCGAESWTIAVADSQSAGRGRMGRCFESQDCSGLYMSVLLRDITNFEPSMLTIITSVCVCHAIEQLTDKTVDIKWVNDIYFKGKKVCGILTEGAFEDNKLSYAVIGIGLNISPPKNGYSDSIKDIAGSVFNSYSDELRDKIANMIIQNLKNSINHYKHDYIYKEYVGRSCVIGKKVKVLGCGESYDATVKEILSDFSLKVVDDYGIVKVLKSGEVSLKI